MSTLCPISARIASYVCASCAIGDMIADRFHTYIEDATDPDRWFLRHNCARGRSRLGIASNVCEDMPHIYKEYCDGELVVKYFIKGALVIECSMTQIPVCDRALKGVGGVDIHAPFVRYEGEGGYFMATYP